MPEQIHGLLNAQGKRFALVVSRFNELVTSRLLEGALDCLRRHGAEEGGISVYWVPGALEIPLAAQEVGRRTEVDAVVCLGAVIRGATPHFDYVAGQAARGIASISLQAGKPVIFGLLTCESMEQALERAGLKGGNKGWEAALHAIEMVDLMARIKEGGEERQQHPRR